MTQPTDVPEHLDPATAGPLQGRPSPFACPDCHGVLWEEQGGDATSYRCRIGHAYSESALLAAHSQSLEAALWAAVRALEERAALVKRTVNRLERRGATQDALRRFEAQAEDATAHAAQVRHVIERLDALTAPAPLDPVS